VPEPISEPEIAHVEKAPAGRSRKKSSRRPTFQEQEK
jgi:hypothetical protein